MLKSLSHVALVTASGLLALPVLAQDNAQAPSGRPANLCQELIAFVKVPEAKKQEAATPPAQATAVSNPSGQSDGKPSVAGGDPQQKSGLSGPSGTADTAPNADDRKSLLARANAAAKGAPAPAPSPPAPKADAATVAQIEAALAVNDQASCRAAARTMRKAGVPMPVPLLALSALDLKFQTSAP